MKIIFFLNLFIVLYVYFGYPLLLLILSCFKSRKIGKAEIDPKVSFVISAFNEEKNIASKIDNTLSLDYPKEKLEIIVASDGSTDRTDQIVGNYRGNGVRLLRIEGRQGKTEAQNQAVRNASGEIIIFSDATTYYNKDVIKKIRLASLKLKKEVAILQDISGPKIRICELQNPMKIKVGDIITLSKNTIDEKNKRFCGGC